MILDGDCHLGVPLEGFGIAAAEMVRQLDENGADRAIVWPLAAYERDFWMDNSVIQRAAREFPDRLIPFGGINPRLGLERALDELRQCRDWGFRGVKLNGARDGFLIDDPHLSLPLIEALHKAGMMLALHCGSNDFERTHPFRVANIARRFPDLPILMVHMGGVGRPDQHMHEAAIEFARQHANILFVASEAHPNYILKAIRTLGAGRVAYGSDTPFQMMHVMRAMMDATLRDVSADERALVMGVSLARWLGLVSA